MCVMHVDLITHLHKIGEEVPWHAVAWVAAKAGDDVPGQVDRPVLYMHKAVQQGLAACQGSTFA